MSCVESPTFWDKHWENKKIGFQEHAALILAAEQILGGFEGKRTLEVGAGRGIDSVRMAQKGAYAYTVDFSKEAVRIVQLLRDQIHVPVVAMLAKGECLPFPDNCFDLVFSQGVIEHPGEKEDLLKEQIRVVKPGRYVLIDVPNKYSMQTPIRDIQVLLGHWPYGKEYPFSSWELKRFMRQFGLTPIKAYGWDLLPLLHLGLRDRLRGKRASSVDSSIQLPPLDKFKGPSLFTRQIEVKIGNLFLNNVGVIAQKPIAQK